MRSILLTYFKKNIIDFKKNIVYFKNIVLKTMGIFFVQPISRNYSPYIIETWHALINNSPFLSPCLALATTILFSDAMSLIIFGTSYEWNHSVCVIQWLAYFF